MDKPAAVARGIAAIVVALSLSGCGGGDETVGAFSTRQGVLVEIGQLGRILISGQRLLGARGADTVFPVHLGASPTMNCDSGTAAAEEGQGARTFAYYNKTGTFDYTRYRFEDCRTDTSPDSSIGQSGLLELGAEAEYDPSNLSDSHDTFAKYGSGEDGYVYIDTAIYSGVTSVRERISGRLERRFSDIGTQAGMVFERVLELTASDLYSLSWMQGLPDEPMYVEDNLGGRISLAGPYAYRSSRCSGGQRWVEGVVYRNDDGYPIAGELTLSSAGDSVTVSFDDSGNALLSFANGSNAAMTAEEIRQALDEPAC